MEKNDKEGKDITVGPWPGSETEEEYRALGGGRDFDNRTVRRHEAIRDAIEKMKNGGEFYPNPPISELSEISPDILSDIPNGGAELYLGALPEPEDEDRVFPTKLFKLREGVVIKGTPIRHRTGIAMLDSIAALEKLEIEDPQEFQKVLIRVFEAGARVELGKPDGSVTWKAMAVALRREPTHAEHIRFLDAMRHAGWVNESFHVQKVRHLQELLQELANKNLPLAGPGVQDLRDENLSLRNLIEEHQAMIEKLRDKLVEQDTVIGQIAGRGGSKGN